MTQRIIGVAVLLLLLETCLAHAQISLLYPIEPPAPFVREALAHPYGRAVLAEFAKTVAASADTACLRSKALDAANLADRGRDIFQRYGTRSMEIIIGNFDVRKYEARISELAGAGAASELIELRNDADVKRYLILERPARLAKVFDFVVENFERYALITRINLRSFSGISTGNDELLRANPIEESEEAIERFVAANTSPRFKRFVELSEITAPAIMDAFNREFALKWGPTTFYRGVESDLAELCVIRR
jgi:hypothetical protein